MAGLALKGNSYTNMDKGKMPDIEMPGAPSPALELTPQSPIAAVPDYVPQEVMQEMQASVPQEPEEVQEVEEAPEPEPELPKKQENSFAKMRWAREKAERERDELMQLLLQQQNKQQAAQPEPEEDYGIGNEELAEGKHIRKVAKELSDMKKQLAAYKQQSQQEIFEAKIKVEYPDFAQVVSEDNVARLKEDHPEVAQMLMNTNDMYNKASSAYKVIKNFGIYKETSTMAREKSQTAQALKNIAKPKPMAAINPQQGDTPLSKANAFATPGALTEEMKAQLRKEMLQARRGV